MISKEDILEHLETSLSIRDIARKLNTTHTHITYLCNKYNIDLSYIRQRYDPNKLLGQRFSMLVVEEVIQEGKRKYAICKCDCSKKKKCRLDSLKSGRYISCGCHAKNRYEMTCANNKGFKGVGELRATQYLEIKSGAKYRGIEFNLSKEYLWDLYLKQERKCALTGVEIRFGRVYHRHETTASLDRIDSNIGYIEGNVQWVLKDINMIKGPYDNEYFIKLCNHVAKIHPREISNP